MARDDGKRGMSGSEPEVAALAVRSDAIVVDTPLPQAVEAFRRFPDARYLAVTDRDGRPYGALRERRVRDLLFSPFGHALLANPGFRTTLVDLVDSCPSAEIDAPVETLIAAYGKEPEAEGIILTRRGKYVGLLPSRALLGLAAARERTEQARRLAEAEAAIARTAALREAFDRFQSDAAELGAALAAAAGEIRASAAGVAERAAQNGAQATAVAAASSQSAQGIAELAMSSAELARQGQLIRGQVGDVEAAVGQAVGHVASGAEKTRSLAAAADAIGGITGLIADIAGRVNMLALNATIEAARAGPAGRSFAVVAGEVKSLADQAGQAAHEIEAQIGAVRAAVAAAAAANQAIETIVERLDAVTGGIRDAVAEQSAASTMIAANVEQCAMASAQISSHVGEMSGRSATAGDMAVRLGEVAAALGARAEGLKGRVDAFLAEIRAA